MLAARPAFPLIAPAMLVLLAGCTTADNAQLASPPELRRGRIGVGEPIGLVGGAVAQQSRDGRSAPPAR